MNIKYSVPGGLSAVKPIVTSELKKTLDERVELGIGLPDDLLVNVRIYNHPRSMAVAIAAPTPIIELNSLPMTFTHFDDRSMSLGRMLFGYFDIARDFFQSSEETIGNLLDDPSGTISKFEESFVSPQALADWKKFFSERGVSYDEYVKYLVDNADDVSVANRFLVSKISEFFDKADFSSLRHEVDHCVFYGSNFHRDNISLHYLAESLSHKWMRTRSAQDSRDYASAKLSLLESDSKVSPLLEARAHFFNYVPIGGWVSVDYDKVKDAINKNLIEGYVDGSFPESILDKLVSLEWSRSRMNRETSNYLFKKVNDARGSLNALRYSPDLSKVNYALATEVLQGLEEWKVRYKENCRLSVDAVCEAFKHDPSRIGKTNSARTFEEILDIYHGRT